MVKLVAGLVCAGLLAAAPSGAVRCGRLLDVKTGSYLTDALVVFEDGKVTAVGKVAVPAGVTPIDLSAMTCLPGLIDVHDHLTGSPENSGYKGLGISIPRETLTGA